MTERSAVHGTFVIERTYEAAPAEVYALWASREAKSRWFAIPDEGGYTLDFRVGGLEANKGGPPGGPVYSFDAQYQEIVPDERIVYGYTMDADDVRISVSVTTVEFAPSEEGTLLTFTEQGVFLDGHDTPAIREGGTGHLLDALGTALK
jgi:uncharacterized protein YndB with AHSA1/START domain